MIIFYFTLEKNQNNNTHHYCIISLHWREQFRHLISFKKYIKNIIQWIPSTTFTTSPLLVIVYYVTKHSLTYEQITTVLIDCMQLTLGMLGIALNLVQTTKNTGRLGPECPVLSEPVSGQRHTRTGQPWPAGAGAGNLLRMWRRMWGWSSDTHR